MKSLSTCAAFVHTSTAYTHSYRTHIDEELYPPTCNTDEFLAWVEATDAEGLDLEAKALKFISGSSATVRQDRLPHLFLLLFFLVSF